MRTLPSEQFDEYCRLVDSCEANAVKGFEAAVSRAASLFADAPDEDERSVWRDAIIDEVWARIDLYRSEAQLRADDLFEAMTNASPAPHAAFPIEAADARVRSAAMRVFENDDVDGFVSVLSEFIAREVRAAANAAIAEDVEAANER